MFRTTADVEKANVVAAAVAAAKERPLFTKW
jgi:hypothetical protein